MVFKGLKKRGRRGEGKGREREERKE